MTDAPSSLSQWKDDLENKGVDAALESLADSFREKKELHQLFEVRQMQVRNRLGLPPHLPPALDSLPQQTQEDLEKGLLDACREVGLALLDDEQLADAWMYLRALGEKSLIAAHLRELPLGRPESEDNPNEVAQVDQGAQDDAQDEEDEQRSELTDQAIHLALYEGVDPAWGLSLMLNQHGTCNSITAASSIFPSLDRATRSSVATTLVSHLHSEVLSNLKSDHERRALPDFDSEGKEYPIAELLTTHPELVEDQSYHVDLSHLMSTLQFARSMTQSQDWKCALDLAEYGSRLSTPLVSAGEEPFVDYYPMHVAYFRCLLDSELLDSNQTEEALAKFESKAQSIDREVDGPQAAETYVDLLARMGRFQQAAEASATFLPPGTATLGISPTLLELSQSAGDFGNYLRLAEERGDLLAYAQALLGQRNSAS